MDHRVSIADLTWTEYQDRMRLSPPVILPVGSLEQHGLHLPMDADTRLAVSLAVRVASDVGGLVLPPISYGARSLARSGGGEVFPGTTNLDGTTLTATIRDVLREQHRHGARRFVILLGHGENDPFAVEGATLAQRDSGDPLMRVLVIGWWHVVRDQALAPLFPEGFPGWDREHAARVETALLMAFAPQSVRYEHIGPVDEVAPPPYTVVPQAPGMVPSQGSLADPQGATPAAGGDLIDLIVKQLAETIATTFAGA